MTMSPKHFSKNPKNETETKLRMAEERQRIQKTENFELMLKHMRHEFCLTLFFVRKVESFELTPKHMRYEFCLAPLPKRLTGNLPLRAGGSAICSDGEDGGAKPRNEASTYGWLR